MGPHQLTCFAYAQRGYVALWGPTSLHASPGKRWKCSHGFPSGDMLCLGELQVALHILFSWQVSFAYQMLGNCCNTNRRSQTSFFSLQIPRAHKRALSPQIFAVLHFMVIVYNTQATFSHAGCIYTVGWPHIIYRRSIPCSLYSFFFLQQNKSGQAQNVKWGLNLKEASAELARCSLPTLHQGSEVLVKVNRNMAHCTAERAHNGHHLHRGSTHTACSGEWSTKGCMRSRL